uniref:RxLR effector candidate protein n=1 Tax=Peronospora matthiolae TaxID=2874970 RepID=A0AAV1U8A5_9STRA
MRLDFLLLLISASADHALSIRSSMGLVDPSAVTLSSSDINTEKRVARQLHLREVKENEARGLPQELESMVRVAVNSIISEEDFKFLCKHFEDERPLAILLDKHGASMKVADQYRDMLESLVRPVAYDPQASL